MIFPVTFLFLLVWSKQKSHKKVRNLSSFLEVHDCFFFLKKNSLHFFNDVRTCTRSEFFASEFMNICDDFPLSVTRMNNAFYSLSKLEYRNLNSCFHLLILLSSDISLDPEPNN